jgi:hypothetical protein
MVQGSRHGLNCRQGQHKRRRHMCGSLEHIKRYESAVRMVLIGADSLCKMPCSQRSAASPRKLLNSIS